MKPAERPKRRFPCIRPRWNESQRDWNWRARVRLDQREWFGPWRPTQEQAYADVVDIRAKISHGAAFVSTIMEAARALRAKKDSHGLSERSLASLDGQQRHLERFWRPETPLTALTTSEISWMIGASVKGADGRPKRSPNTILQKDLPYLRRLLRIAGLPTTPVDDARDDMRRHLKYVPPRMAFFEPEEVAEIIRRMREEQFTDRYGNVVEMPAREWHADIVELLATTGIRNGELSRIRVDDCDMRRGRIHIESKDRGHPRDAEILPVAMPALERLVERARGHEGELLVPGGENFLCLMFGRWKKRLGEPRLSGRTLRHSFGSFVFHMARNPAEARAVLGHRSMATTQRYLHELGLHPKESLKRIQEWWASVKADATSPPAGDEPSPPSPDGDGAPHADA